MVTTPSITPPAVWAQAAAIAETAAIGSAVYATRPDKEGCYGVCFKSEAISKGRVTRFDLRGEDVYIREGIRHIISSKPMLATADFFSTLMHESEYEHVRKYAAGELLYPRLEALHSLLCRGHSPYEITAVENGCGCNPHLTMVLAAMGTRVFLKEPDDSMVGSHIRSAERHLPPDWVSRMTYLSEDESSMPANIVYWINPSPSMFQHLLYPSRRTLRNMDILVDYMGRDVAVGGFLVLQTPEMLYHDLYFDHSKWIPLFDSANNIDDEIEGIAFPTDLPRDNNYLRIFRRIA